MKQALLIIDVQNDYFKNGKMELQAPEKALAQINQLETRFLEKKEPIIYIQHINNTSNPSFFEPETYGVELHDGLKTDDHSLIVTKAYPNSFLATTLTELLNSFNVEQLVITGMMTHMCIDSTTRASAELGYQPILIADATATRTLTIQEKQVHADDVQASFLAALQHFSQVISTDDYLNSH